MKKYFLLDTYQSHRAKIINGLEIGSITSFVLNQGNIYQFYLNNY
ncbi:hypothetical protein [endosymbiont GvMRE of Glomus versiforme]|nr:hypothetical protein [endosymbiont GvMRE of Glomus versiforme]